MADAVIAKLFTGGRSRAVRLAGDSHRHVWNADLGQPIAPDVQAWLAELDRFICWSRGRRFGTG